MSAVDNNKEVQWRCKTRITDSGTRFLRGSAPNLPAVLHAAGFFPSTAPIFEVLYTRYPWFIGPAFSAVVYYLLI